MDTSPMPQVCFIHSFISSPSRSRFANIALCTGIKRKCDHDGPALLPALTKENRIHRLSEIDERRSDPIMYLDEDNDSILAGGSAARTPKWSSLKRNVDAGASPRGRLLTDKLPIAAGGRGAKKLTRRRTRGREMGVGRVSLKDWNIPYPDIGPPPLLTLTTSPYLAPSLDHPSLQGGACEAERTERVGRKGSF
jgi:hypothetical protein